MTLLQGPELCKFCVQGGSLVWWVGFFLVFTGGELYSVSVTGDAFRKGRSR